MKKEDLANHLTLNVGTHKYAPQIKVSDMKPGMWRVKVTNRMWVERLLRPVQHVQIIFFEQDVTKGIEEQIEYFYSTVYVNLFRAHALMERPTCGAPDQNQ